MKIETKNGWYYNPYGCEVLPNPENQHKVIQAGANYQISTVTHSENLIKIYNQSQTFKVEGKLYTQSSRFKT